MIVYYCFFSVCSTIFVYNFFCTCKINYFLHILSLSSLFYQKKDKKHFTAFYPFFEILMLSGGVERVRTSAPLSRPNCLANNPLHHLGTTPFFIN